MEIAQIGAEIRHGGMPGATDFGATPYTVPLLQEALPEPVTRHHGVARRVESRRPQCTQSLAAARLCGAPPHCGPPACVASGPTTPCSRRRSFMRCTCGSSINGRSIGRIGRTSLVSRRRSCAGSWSITPGVAARASGAAVCSACRLTRQERYRRSNEMPILALDHALDRLAEADADLATNRRASRIWRTDHRGSGTCAQCVAIHRDAGLAHRESVAPSRARPPRSVGDRRALAAREGALSSRSRAAGRRARTRSWSMRPATMMNCVAKSSRF